MGSNLLRQLRIDSELTDDLARELRGPPDRQTSARQANGVSGMSDGFSKDAAQDRRTVTRSANGDTPQTISEATHALSERLTAMTAYFGAIRANLSTGDHKAAEETTLRFLEQSERAREIGQRLRALLNANLP